MNSRQKGTINNNLPMEKLLSSGELTVALKIGLSPLIDYICQDAIISQMAEWCLSTKYIHSTNFKELSEIAVSFFTSNSSKIYNFVQSSTTLSTYFHEFLKSDDSNNSLLAGYFSRIIENQIKWNTPLLFQMFGDSVDLILNRINVLGIQEILILILTKSMSFIENNSIILRISEMLTQDEETSRNAAYVLCSVYNNSSITTPIISQYNNPKVVQLMINYALSTKSIVAMTDMIILCSKIISNNPINDFLTQEQIQQLTITSDNVTQLTISAIDIIHEDIEYLFSFFFRHETLHQKLVQMLQNENTENIVNVSKIPGFVSKLIEHFRSGKWCIHMDAVVQVFELVSCYSSALQTTEWNDFISVDYNQRNAIIKNNTEEWLPLAGLCEPGISLGEEYSFIEPANDGYGYYKSKTNSGYGGYFEDDTPSIDFGDELIIDI